MAFPLNPTIGDTFTIGNKTYQWNGNVWLRSIITDAENILSSYALDSDLTTANTVEHTTHLYFTNARVYSNVIALDYTTNTYVNTSLLTKANVADLTTANVSEATNLYFTNTRAISSLTAGSGITIAANGRITMTETGTGTVSSVFGQTSTVSNAQLACAVITTGVLNTANVAEGANLYFTNTRAIGALTSGSGISIAANGLITSSGAVTSVAGQVGAISNAQLACAVISSGVLNTANVSEGANLYFTNTRAIGALTSGTGISIAANGRITGTATGSSIDWQSAQSSNFAAVAGRGYPVNTTSASIAVTLPASPSIGQQIVLSDYAGTFATNSLTVYPNGNKINGNTANVFATANRVSINLVYLDSTQGWIVSYGWGGTGLVGALTADYLIVAGGGGSQSVTAGAGGGAGAGGLLQGSGQALTLNVAYNLSVGAGGAGGGSNGTNSSFTGTGLSGLTAVGGGGASGLNGASGGSGGGASASYPSSGTGGSGTAGQGNAGGNSGVQLCGGGGGGAGAAGTGDGNTGGNGGVGIQSTITGSAVYYAGGGAGGGCNNRAVGTAGSGGGGAAGSPGGNNAGSPGGANTGGGGGGPTILGGGYSAPGVSGGSGIVILRIPNTHTATFSVGLTTSLSTSQAGYKTYSITGGTGTVTFSLA